MCSVCDVRVRSLLHKAGQRNEVRVVCTAGIVFMPADLISAVSACQSDADELQAELHTVLYERAQEAGATLEQLQSAEASEDAKTQLLELLVALKTESRDPAAPQGRHNDVTASSGSTQKHTDSGSSDGVSHGRPTPTDKSAPLH
eukprot:COSAG01_NODE_2366_length_7816_cov_3.797460_9_plen_145_part_00